MLRSSEAENSRIWRYANDDLLIIDFLNSLNIKSLFNQYTNKDFERACSGYSIDGQLQSKAEYLYYFGIVTMIAIPCLIVIAYLIGTKQSQRVTAWLYLVLLMLWLIVSVSFIDVSMELDTHCDPESQLYQNVHAVFKVLEPVFIIEVIKFCFLCLCSCVCRCGH